MRQELRASQELISRATAGRVPLIVRGMPYPCWRCRHDDLAVAMIHLEGMTGSYDVITTDERLALAYAAELLSAAGHPQAASIKSRKSRTANETYLSNGCIRCDALFGQFFISEDLADVVVKGAVNSLPILVNVTRPAIEWYALAGLSATSGNLM